MTRSSALRTVIDNDGKEPVPLYMLNPATGRIIRTDSNKNRKALNLPLLPRKERADKGKPRGPYKRKHAATEPKEAPAVKVDGDKESIDMINHLLKENNPPEEEEEEEDDATVTEDAAEEEGGADEEEEEAEETLIQTDVLKDEVFTDTRKVKQAQRNLSNIRGIVFPSDYSAAYRDLVRDSWRSHSK